MKSKQQQHVREEDLIKIANGAKEESVIDIDGEDVLLSLFGSKMGQSGVDNFLQTLWKRERAVLISGTPKRLAKLRADYLFDLDVNAMLENTASDQIHVWLKTASSLDSIRVSDASQAISLYKAGHSLYCRASTELEQTLVPRMLSSLAHGVAGGGDRLRRGEVETFYSKRGHVTDWHTDFQENFTIMLSGEKKWSFKQGSIVGASPLRGCTPHFGPAQGNAVTETQLKVLRLGDDSFDASQVHDAAEKEDSIILRAGDVLYHPAGIWHKVECLSDSLAINVSLVGGSYAELACNAIQQVRKCGEKPVLEKPTRRV